MTEKTYTICPQCNQINRVPFESPQGKAPVCGKCGTTLQIHDGVSELSASGLQSLAMKSPLPVVVDFWAPWCQPCRVFAPTFLQAAQRLAGKAVLAKINTEANPLAGDFYHIRGIPTLIVLENGIELDRQSGAFPLDPFLRWVEGTLRSKAG